ANDGRPPTLAPLAAPAGGWPFAWGGPARMTDVPPRSLRSLPPQGAGHSLGAALREWHRAQLSGGHERAALQRHVEKRAGERRKVAIGRGDEAPRSRTRRERRAHDLHRTRAHVAVDRVARQQRYADTLRDAA